MSDLSPTTPPPRRWPVTTHHTWLPTKDMFIDTFQAVVGQSPGTVRTFTLHVGVFTHYSGFFKAALKSDTFKEGQEKVVKLPEEDPDDFQGLVRWVYTRETDHFHEHAWSWLRGLVIAGILADRYVIPVLGNEVMTDLAISTVAGMDIKDIQHTEGHLAINSNMRRLMATFYVLCFDSEYADVTFSVETKEAFSKDTWREMLLASLKYRDAFSLPKTSNRSDYLTEEIICRDFHYHDRHEGCY